MLSSPVSTKRCSQTTNQNQSQIPHHTNSCIPSLALGLAPPYISELLHPYSTSRPLRSSDLGLLLIFRSFLKSRGDCTFAVRAPSLWNSLPSSVRSAESLSGFKKLLKTHLYHLAFPATVTILCIYVNFTFSYFVYFYNCFYVCLL